MGRMKAEVDAKKEEELGETLKEEEEERPVREGAILISGAQKLRQTKL